MIAKKPEKRLLVKGQVVKTAQGSVSWLDSLKNYYKGVIAVVGSVLIIVNELSPALDFIPAAKGTVTTVIAVLTAAATFLKSNEQWVDNL